MPPAILQILIWHQIDFGERKEDIALFLDFVFDYDYFSFSQHAGYLLFRDIFNLEPTTKNGKKIVILSHQTRCHCFDIIIHFFIIKFGSGRLTGIRIREPKHFGVPTCDGRNMRCQRRLYLRYTIRFRVKMAFAFAHKYTRDMQKPEGREDNRKRCPKHNKN